MGKSTINGPFSIAMLVYQRVTNPEPSLLRSKSSGSMGCHEYSEFAFTTDDQVGACSHEFSGKHLAVPDPVNYPLVN
jgi:hypothetical protein